MKSSTRRNFTKSDKRTDGKRYIVRIGDRYFSGFEPGTSESQFQPTFTEDAMFAKPFRRETQAKDMMTRLQQKLKFKSKSQIIIR